MPHPPRRRSCLAVSSKPLTHVLSHIRRDGDEAASIRNVANDRARAVSPVSCTPRGVNFEESNLQHGKPTKSVRAVKPVVGFFYRVLHVSGSLLARFGRASGRIVAQMPSAMFQDLSAGVFGFPATALRTHGSGSSASRSSTRPGVFGFSQPNSSTGETAGSCYEPGCSRGCGRNGSSTPPVT